MRNNYSTNTHIHNVSIDDISVEVHVHDEFITLELAIGRTKTTLFVPDASEDAIQRLVATVQNITVVNFTDNDDKELVDA